MKQYSCCFIVIVALLAGTLFPAGNITVAQNQKASKTNEYVLEVEGTAGVQLDMLLITKPTEDEGPTRESARITIPYKKKFSAAKCFAWLDTLPKNGSGKIGDKYHIVLKRNGKPTAEGNNSIRQDVHSTTGLGDL